MKIKTILFLIIITLLIFLIYLTNEDKEIYYVNIDSTNNNNYNEIIKNNYKKNKKLEKYLNNFSKEDYRTTDLIRDIKDNKEIGKITIQNALIKSDILTLNIGINDINYKIGNTNKEELYNYTDQVLDDIDELLKLIRSYSKERIYFIGFKNTKGLSYNNYFEYTNKRLQSICKQYNILFINIDKKEDINSIVSNFVLNY